MASRGCNLECVTGEDAGKDVIEFLGPVKIILVEQPRNLYMRKRFAAAAIVLSHMMMGAASMTVLYYTLSYKKENYLKAIHIILGTVGFQLCMPSGILAVHKLAGSTAVMRLPHRPFEHAFLQIFALLCGLSSIATAIIFDRFQITFHCMTGIIATGIALSGIPFGLIIYDRTGTRTDIKELSPVKAQIHQCHKYLGMIAFTMSSACFISGMLKPTFMAWAPIQEIPYIPILFCVIYTLVILYKPLKEHYVSLFYLP